MPTLNTTKVFEEILEAWVGKKRGILLEGGTSSSKTFSALQFLDILAEKTPISLLMSVVSETLPHLKRGAQRDFFSILEEPIDNNKYFNKTEGTYSRPGWKGKIEFFGADDDSKVRGPRRQILFINEGNNIPWATAQGLDARTDLFVIVDWNPVGEFWAHEYWLADPRFAYSHSTYLDAKSVLKPEVIENIESYKNKDPNWWNIYGLGLIGKIEGLVYPHFDQVDELPKGDKVYGLDFGFTDDPAVLVANVIIGEDVYSDEVIYQTGLTNDVLARNMDLAGVRKNYDEIWADSAEPKSIEELHLKGFNIKPCEKGKGSVEFGIQKVNQYKQHWTKRSINCIKEQRNFRYIADKDGHLTDKTTHKFSHGMDARRYPLQRLTVATDTGVHHSMSRAEALGRTRVFGRR